MASLKAVNQHLVSATEHKQEVGCQLSKRPALIQNWLYLKIWVKYLKMERTWGPLIGTTYIVIFYFLFFASKIFFSFFLTRIDFAIYNTKFDQKFVWS